MKYTGERILEDHGNLVEARLYYNESLKYISGNILDAACGSGWASRMIQTHLEPGKRYIGGDVSYEAVEYARQQYKIPGVHFVQLDVTNLPFYNGSIDTYLSIETIEHIPEVHLADVFSEAHRVIKPGGTYFLTTPDYDVMPYRPTSQEEVWGHHYRHYKASELEAALNMFKEVRIYKLFEQSSLIVVAKA